MGTVLYITAHPLTDTQSYSLAVGTAFLEAYRETAPEDEIVRLDLYNMEIPQIDADIFRGWGRLRAGTDFSGLSAVEQRKVKRLGELVDQFVAADRYIFVTPLWNFSYPPFMKAYLDAICVAGKTFRYTEAGPVGLLTDKRAVHIQARGGIYSAGPAAQMEMGHRHLAAIMAFFGVPSFEGVFVEGHNAFPDQAEGIKEAAIEHAREVARRFAGVMVPA